MPNLHDCDRCGAIINRLELPIISRWSVGSLEGGVLELTEEQETALHPLILAILKRGRLLEYCLDCQIAVLLDPEAEAERLVEDVVIAEEQGRSPVRVLRPRPSSSPPPR